MTDNDLIKQLLETAYRDQPLDGEVRSLLCKSAEASATNNQNASRNILEELLTGVKWAVFTVMAILAWLTLMW